MIVSFKYSWDSLMVRLFWNQSSPTCRENEVCWSSSAHCKGINQILLSIVLYLWLLELPQQTCFPIYNCAAWSLPWYSIACYNKHCCGMMHLYCLQQHRTIAPRMLMPTWLMPTVVLKKSDVASTEKRTAQSRTISSLSCIFPSFVHWDFLFSC